MVKRKIQNRKVVSGKKWFALVVVLLAVIAVVVLVLKYRPYFISRPANVPEDAWVCRKNFKTVYITTARFGLEGENFTAVYDSKGQIILRHLSAGPFDHIADMDAYKERARQIKEYQTEYTCRPGPQVSSHDTWFVQP